MNDLLTTDQILKLARSLETSYRILSTGFGANPVGHYLYKYGYFTRCFETGKINLEQLQIIAEELAKLLYKEQEISFKYYMQSTPFIKN